mmetsp:Transcript_182438/g.578160  ORF Transcript_182438/g.578160 Transcript_182438/m.578160 type:complete len:303 (+) Transcript_182438:257-1165(+)
MPIVQLLRLLAEGTVHHSPAHNGRALRDLLRPSDHMLVLLHLQELGGPVELAEHKPADPWPDGHVRDGVLLSAHVRAPGSELFVQHVDEPLGLHGVAVNAILDLDRSVAVEVPESTTDEGGTPHLPHEPRLDLRTQGVLLREEHAVLVKLVGQVHQNCSGLEDSHWLRCIRVVHHRWDLGIRIDCLEPGFELRTTDGDEPCVILEVGKQLDELLEHDRHLHAIGRAHGIQLQTMFALGQWLVFSPRPGIRAIGATELTSHLLVLPNLGDLVLGRQRWLLLGRHRTNLSVGTPQEQLERQYRS